MNFNTTLVTINLYRELKGDIEWKISIQHLLLLIKSEATGASPTSSISIQHLLLLILKNLRNWPNGNIFQYNTCYY